MENPTTMSAEEHLNKLDIWNHPRITDRNEKESYDVAEIMESYAREYHAKEMEKKLGIITEALKTKPHSNTGLMYDRGWEDALDVVGNEILNHLKQSNKE